MTIDTKLEVLRKQEMVDLAGKVLDGDADEHDKHSLANMVLDWFMAVIDNDS